MTKKNTNLHTREEKHWIKGAIQYRCLKDKNYKTASSQRAMILLVFAISSIDNDFAAVETKGGNTGHALMHQTYNRARDTNITFIFISI